MQFARLWRDVVSGVVLLAILIGGEIPARLGVEYLIIPGAKRALPGWTGTGLFVAECVVSVLVIFVVGCLLALISVLINRRPKAAKKTPRGWFARWGWSREDWLVRFLERGRPVGVVLGSYIGGGWGGGWFYGRRNDPKALAKAVGCAAILAPPSGTFWVSNLNPVHPWVGPVITAAIVLLAIPATRLVRPAHRPQHAAR